MVALLEHFDPLLVDGLLLVFDHGVPPDLGGRPGELQLVVLHPLGQVVVLPSPAPELVTETYNNSTDRVL